MTDSERTRPFYPGDNPIPLADIDWKSRYDELKNRKDWDEKRDFVGMKRLGSSYHLIDPFFKFESAPEENKKFDKYWYPFFIGIGFTGAYITANYWARRPIFGGLVPALFCGALGVGVGLTGYHINQVRSRDRDAVLMHYMLLHEHELPTIGIYNSFMYYVLCFALDLLFFIYTKARKKFGEIMKPWVPLRTMDYSSGPLFEKKEYKTWP